MKFPRLVTNYILENVTMVDVEIRGRNRDEKGKLFFTIRGISFDEVK